MVDPMRKNWKQSQMYTRVRHLFRAVLATAVWGLMSCSQSSEDTGLHAAEAFIDAFYTFDPELLATTLDAGEDEANMLYYQGWAEAANYRVQTRRPCTREAGGNTVICRITVTDDFGSTLGYVATDTFTLTLDGSIIVGVESAGDDPPIFMELFQWIGANRPEVMTGPCKNLFTPGGETPGLCAQAVVDSARAFVDVRARDPDQHDK